MVLKALVEIKYYNIMLKVTMHSILMWLIFSLCVTKRGSGSRIIKVGNIRYHYSVGGKPTRLVYILIEI